MSNELSELGLLLEHFQSETFIARGRARELEVALNNLLNDCINFDGGKLTDVIMAEASRVLKS